MVVRLDLERHRHAVPDRDDPGVLAWPLEHVRRLGGQRTKQGSRMLVGAVLTPERTDDPQLGERRLAAKHVDETIVLAEGEPVLGDERGGDLRVAWAGGNGHGLLVAGVLAGAGAIVGGWVGIDGFTSFGLSGGVM